MLQFDVEADLVPQMRECATHAFTSVLNKLNPIRRQHCFELFGLDFMVDANHKVGYYNVIVETCVCGQDDTLAQLLQANMSSQCNAMMLLHLLMCVQ